MVNKEAACRSIENVFYEYTAQSHVSVTQGSASVIGAYFRSA